MENEKNDRVRNHLINHHYAAKPVPGVLCNDPSSTAEKAEQKASIREMANKTLSDLYAKNPRRKLK